MSGDAELNEWNLLLNQFHALVRKGSDSSEDIFDAQFSHRFSRVIDQAARPTWRRWDDGMNKSGRRIFRRAWVKNKGSKATMSRKDELLKLAQLFLFAGP